MTTARPTGNRKPRSYSDIVPLEFDRELPPDLLYQEEHLRIVTHSLRSHFRALDTFMDRSPNGTLVSNTCVICYDPNDLNVKVEPDCAIAFGVDLSYLRDRVSYVVAEVGKPPEFVLEVASPSTARFDRDRKRRIYERIGIPEYWRFDPSGGNLYGQALAGDRLVNGVYQPIDIISEPSGEMWGHSEVLALSLCYKNEMFVAYDRESGRYVMTDIEEHAAYREAQVELEAAQARVRELEEQLRRREPGEGSQG